ncbi:MAG: hypothetical protein AAGD07_17870 [Planctomycetota bacterium]
MDDDNFKRTMLGCLATVLFLSGSCAGQESDGRVGTIVIEAKGSQPAIPVIYTAHATTLASFGTKRIEQTVELSVRVLQGQAEVLTFGLHGSDEVMNVKSGNIQSWSVRRVGDQRYLDLTLKENTDQADPIISLRSAELTLPQTLDLTHLTPGDAVGFNSVITLEEQRGVDCRVLKSPGFFSLDAEDGGKRFQTSTGGTITVAVAREGTAPGPAELFESELIGHIAAESQSVQFQFQGMARVSESDAEIPILSGDAAISRIPENENYRVRLAEEGGDSVYKLVFPKPGTFPVSLEFAAALQQQEGDVGFAVQFRLWGGAIVPLTLTGLDDELVFEQVEDSIVPKRMQEGWHGFLPASGRVHLRWRAASRSGEGKLFFTTQGMIDCQVGTGLLRQLHQMDYQVLQGELNALAFELSGPGEILDVEGDGLVSWRVSNQDDQRVLEVTLSRALTKQGRFRIRSQTEMDVFPVRVEGLRLEPVGAIRHSGFMRIRNSGSVRVEATDLQGLTQLSPEQFPGEAVEARQVFVYRFPAAEHSYEVAADRIQSEVNISHLITYQVAETDRVIRAVIEMDIREAPIREWSFGVPEDYSIVSVVGANIADYLAATEVSDGQRNLKLFFTQDVMGRQLVELHLEKNDPAEAEDWQLPGLAFPGAKTVRGNIGVSGVPGLRISIADARLLVETPLSSFPQQEADLQQAFRIRDPEWSATMRIEVLDRSVQSDVFHLYSLSQATVYGSALINYFVTGAPVTQWRLSVPKELGNIRVDGHDVRTWRREGDTLVVMLQQGVMGPSTLLITFEQTPANQSDSFQAGQVEPLDVQGERGYIQVVSPMQVKLEAVSETDDMLKLDALELPAEFRLLSAAPSLGTWQYTDRLFDLKLKVDWFEPGAMATQVVEYSEANTRVSKDGELVTDLLYYVKSRGQRALRLRLPDHPVRLWEVSVNGTPATARQTDSDTLIPLPGDSDANEPVEVRLRLGKPSLDASYPQLTLPTVDAPVLKTQWNIDGDEGHVLVPSKGTVSPATPVLRPSGWTQVTQRGLGTAILVAIFLSLGLLLPSNRRGTRFVAFGLLVAATLVSASAVSSALAQVRPLEPLRLSLPILAAAEPVELTVNNMGIWRANISWFGVSMIITGIFVLAWALYADERRRKVSGISVGVLLAAMGVLTQREGAPWFWGILTLTILVGFVLPRAFVCLRDVRQGLSRGGKGPEASRPTTTDGEGGVGAATATALLFAVAISSAGSNIGATEPTALKAADQLQQTWSIAHEEVRLRVSGAMTASGYPGDQFLLLRSPGVLTKFEADGLRLTKRTLTNQESAYVVGIPHSSGNFVAREELIPNVDSEPDAEVTNANRDDDKRSSATSRDRARDFEVKFEYLLDPIHVTNGIPVLTGIAAIQEIELDYDEPGWTVACASAVQVKTDSHDSHTSANILLGPAPAKVVLSPRTRDVRSEETQFFVEASNLYLPGPGVIDGRHRLHLRVAQGQVGELQVLVPSGLTVSDVKGPVKSWQFDADKGGLEIELEPMQASDFDVFVDTQSGLDPLPADATLAPLRVQSAHGEIGMIGIAFGSDAQPERLESSTLSMVSVGDFDSVLAQRTDQTLHRVYRYGAAGGEVALRVGPVEPEVRVVSKQVLSLGDERVVLGINFVAEISRAGLFQMSFPLPEGLEVESLSGASLHHWSELTVDNSRQIILHLKGKTIGAQEFSLTLSGVAPTNMDQWEVPRFEVAEALRQTGDLVVRPTTGVRLRTLTRQNVSETDPRELGGSGRGALAFRVLQRDWNLVLGIEMLEPWVTGQVLHETTLREGQTRTALFATFEVKNASIRTLDVRLPVRDEDVIKTIRVNGQTVSDFIRAAPDADLWELQFKRRVIGLIEFQIEYERRGDREDERELLRPAAFPQARQLGYYFAVRAGGRLEIEHEGLSQGWQTIDWNTIPSKLRAFGKPAAPAFTLRSRAPTAGLAIQARRHSLADALKLRVAKGAFTTVLSPTGDQLTSVDLQMEVIQRGTLTVGLPEGSELFSIFVNDESVHSIRQSQNSNIWQFYILPGIDDRTAKVRFVYSIGGDRLSNLALTSPVLNVPLENISWSVVAPRGFDLVDQDGNLEWADVRRAQVYNRDSYLSKLSVIRQSKARQAAVLLDRASEFLQAGEQSKAGRALNSVANQYALDAASNEDARVQLENLQTQQAIAGLNTRRQRFYLDNNKRNDIARGGDEQLLQAAAANPILQRDELDFRPQQLSQLLRGNSMADNAALRRIAMRLVQHQHTTEPAPQAITISLPEEGEVYRFTRSIQVAENAPLELNLDFDSTLRTPVWRTVLLLTLLALLAGAIATRTQQIDGVSKKA